MVEDSKNASRYRNSFSSTRNNVPEISNGGRNQSYNDSDQNIHSNNLNDANSSRMSSRDLAKNRLSDLLSKKRLLSGLARKRSILKKKLAARRRESSAGQGEALAVFMITIVLALFLDLLDIIGTLGVETIVLTILTYAANAICSILITLLWYLIFSGSKAANKKQTRMLIRSILILLGVESIPVIELLPFNAIAVILNYIDYKRSK